jgi:hypothetical protein
MNAPHWRSHNVPELFNSFIFFVQVSGISTEIFRQIETVENDHDATTAAALEAVERRGEMVVRLLDPRHMGRAASESAKPFLALQVKLCPLSSDIL